MSLYENVVTLSGFDKIEVTTEPENIAWVSVYEPKHSSDPSRRHVFSGIFDAIAHQDPENMARWYASQHPDEALQLFAELSHQLEIHRKEHGKLPQMRVELGTIYTIKQVAQQLENDEHHQF